MNGQAEWLYAPTVGWVFALISTVLIFFILCCLLTYQSETWAWSYEEIGEPDDALKKKKKKPLAQKEKKVSGARYVWGYLS